MMPQPDKNYAPATVLITILYLSGVHARLCTGVLTARRFFPPGIMYAGRLPDSKLKKYTADIIIR